MPIPAVIVRTGSYPGDLVAAIHDREAGESDNMSNAPTTSKKHSAPSASTTAARLGGYLTVSIGAGVLGTSQADAGIVTIDIGPTGFNIGGVNAGLAAGAYTQVNNFPFSGGGKIGLLNQTTYYFEDDEFKLTGFYGYNGLLMANLYAAGGRVTNFSAGTMINGSSGFSPDYGYGSSGTFYYRKNSNAAVVSPDFGPGSYVGFTTVGGNFGWLEVTWSSSTREFQIHSGAYESVPGVGIKAGVVPEPALAGPAGVCALVMGSLAVLEHRRRKRMESDPAADVA